MGKDVTAFRERFNAYKNGKSVSEIYDAGLPKYAGGKANIVDLLDQDLLDTLHYIHNYFSNRGMSTEDIAGIAANIFKESSFRHNAKDSAGYHGYVQMSPDMLLAVANEYGNLDPDTQLLFIFDLITGNGRVKGYTNGLGYKYGQYKTGGDAAEAFRSTFERNKAGRQQSRIDYGNQFYDYFSNLALQNAVGELPAPIVAQPDATAVRRVIPKKHTKARWTGAENVSPYLTGKPILKLKKEIKPTDIVELHKESLWKAPMLFKDGKLPEYADGKIYIKPENRGKFTALKKRTGHSASWFKENGTPAQKKMATFALNAKKWHHADGKLPEYGGGKIGHNVSHAKMNDDDTFTDDYTKVFEDMYVTPQKTDLKRGSYTLNNFPYYLQHRTDWMKPFMSSSTNEKGLELTHPEFDILLGGRQLATTMFPLKKSSHRQFEEIDFDDIAKQAAKMKADDDAWMVAHPEYTLENVLKPQKIFDVQGNIINGKSKDLLTRLINGWIELHGIPLQEYTNTVKTAYQKQIIPRRAQSYANEQTTSGVSKINKYLKDNWLDDVDFSTKEGLLMAHDNGWSFEEMADWSDYKQYIQKLQLYSNGPWTKYEQESWKKLYPVKLNGSQVKGDYSTYNNKIRVVDYDSTDDTLLHEARHRMDNFIPLTKSEKNTLTNAYGNIWADSQDEIITTNADLRNYLLKINNAENTGLQVLNGLLNNLKFVSDYDILNALDRVNSYGSRAVLKIQVRLDNLKNAGKRLGWDDETINAKVAEERHKIADAIRYAITTVGGTSAVVTVSKK